jgi:small subunit ribosomal protein S16
LVTIRLTRMGSAGEPFYRIVASDSRKATDGRILESLGHYDPLRKPMEVKIDEARVFHWLSTGAQVSDTVRSLFQRLGTWSKWTRISAGEQGITPEVVFLKGERRTK